MPVHINTIPKVSFLNQRQIAQFLKEHNTSFLKNCHVLLSDIACVRRGRNKNLDLSKDPIFLLAVEKAKDGCRREPDKFEKLKGVLRKFGVDAPSESKSSKKKDKEEFNGMLWRKKFANKSNPLPLHPVSQARKHAVSSLPFEFKWQGSGARLSIFESLAKGEAQTLDSNNNDYLIGKLSLKL